MKTLFISLVVAVAAFAAGVWYAREYNPTPVVETLDITTPMTTPEMPKATYINASADTIIVSTPLPGAIVGNTFTVSGMARAWYFEGSFPAEIRSATGTRLLMIPVQAQGEWMTSEFVPFAAQITIPGGYTGAVTLILHKDNPSDMREHDASISIPITIR